MSPPGEGVPLHAPTADEIEAIVRGRHANPFAVLGMHGKGPEPPVVRVFAPEAAAVTVLDARTGETVADLVRLHPDGFFSGSLADGPLRYRLRLRADETMWEQDDPYAFSSLLGELDEHLIAEGRHEELYRKLGAHPVTHEDVRGTAFAVWAPNARRVSVVGDFNGWDGRRNPMRRRGGAGLWELFIPDLAASARYKYEIVAADGERLPLKADPVGFSHEAAPGTASRVHGLPVHAWQDGAWCASRAEVALAEAPVAVYEVHLGSWRRDADGELLDYATVAELLVEYVLAMGFTHVELLPVGEHPFVGSWGYQPTGLFAPTARHGAPEGFAVLVDRLHRGGIGVILDWVPAHFPSDPHGLARFDGTALYEHEDPRRGFHKDWNTLIYDFGRPEVANFLRASALFWLDQYHVDALRVDAVTSMLRLDYSREPGEWEPNRYGGPENLEAVAFVRETNRQVRARAPSHETIAEESSAWPGVTHPLEADGLGFGFKWNLGWMHDTLDYMGVAPSDRGAEHNRITFGFTYLYTEKFVLPLSHDEVVHGKGSLYGKMAGEGREKFANLRAYFGFMWGHPGKKLLFMGGEFAQEREWNHDRALDWHLLEDAENAGVQRLVSDLNRLYRAEPALHRRDCEPEGFQWVEPDDSTNSVFSFLRFGDGGSRPVLVVSNMGLARHEAYRLGVPGGGHWRELLNTDAETYGGSGLVGARPVAAETTPCHGHPASLRLRLAPLATIFLVPERN